MLEYFTEIFTEKYIFMNRIKHLQIIQLTKSKIYIKNIFTTSTGIFGYKFPNFDLIPQIPYIIKYLRNSHFSLLKIIKYA